MTGPGGPPDLEEAPGLPPGLRQKTLVALVLFAALAGLAFRTMEAGSLRTVVMVVLGFLAVRLLLGLRGSR